MKDICISNPATGEIVGSVPTQNSINAEVKSARNALPEWSSLSQKERSDRLRLFAELISLQKNMLGTLECDMTGKLLRECIKHDVDRAASNIEFFASYVQTMQKEKFIKNHPATHTSFESVVTPKSVGVHAMIVPWNSPLLLATWMMGPVLAVGGTCVIKPSPWAPLSLLKLVDIAREAGIPNGVINVVCGGPSLGKKLVGHSEIDHVFFTGSAKVGKEVNIKNAHTRLRPPTLELGGKAVNIICESADIKLAVQGVVRSAFRSQGQSCVAGSRLLIHTSIYSAFMDLFIKTVKQLKIGDPCEPDTDIGPLITKKHLHRVLGFINRARNTSSGTLRLGGYVLNDVLTTPALKYGNFLTPTIFENVPSKSELWQEEIFGPVVAVRSFKTNDEAIREANNTQYGLSSNLWTQNEKDIDAIVPCLEIAMIWINDHFKRDLNAPFGGIKSSGNAFVGGRRSIDQVTWPQMLCQHKKS